MLSRFQAAASQAWRVTSGITLLLPDVNPNNGLALHDFVPVILEEDFSTKAYPTQVPVETDHLLRSDKLRCPLNREFYGVTGCLPLPTFPGSATCIFTSPHGPEHGCRPSPNVNVLRGHPQILTSPCVMLETGLPGVQPQHGLYVRSQRPTATPPATRPTVDEGLLPPVVMHFGD